MPVRTLDHVNIVTRDLPGTVDFYRQVMGFTVIDPPAPLEPDLIQWLCDMDGRPILHIVDRRRMVGREGFADRIGEPTGAIDHVALECEGLDEMKARLDAAGLDYRVSGVAGISLTQLFVRDPNGVLLELNFRGG